MDALITPHRFGKRLFKMGLNGCWLWSGGVNADGYGTARFGNRTDLAHRISWRVHRGPIPAGAHILHYCDTPPCVNPTHLFAGSHADNMADRQAKGNTAAKLTDAEVRRVRSVGGLLKQREIALAFGISQPLVSMILSGAHRVESV